MKNELVFVLGSDMGGQPILGPDTSAQLVVGPETNGQSSLESDTQDTVQSGTPQGDMTLVTGDTNQGYVADMSGDTCDQQNWRHISDLHCTGKWSSLYPVAYLGGH